MKHHRLTLTGGVEGELRVPAEILQEAIAALIEGVRLATRFTVEGESLRRGQRPAWLDRACAIDVTGLTGGCAKLDIEAPTLAEADAGRFGGRQVLLFSQEDGALRDRTAVDLFGSVLASVLEKDAEDVLADRALLETCARFVRSVEGSEFSGIVIEGLHGRTEPLRLRQEHLPQIELLRDETPSPQAVRLSAVLDTISASRSDVTLTMTDGVKVPARLEEYDRDTLQSLWGRTVVVSGMARYRPSGRLLMIDVESIEAASATDALFEVLPHPRAGQVVVPVPQGEGEGVGAFFGTWPGAESEDELLEALRVLG